MKELNKLFLKTMLTLTAISIALFTISGCERKTQREHMESMSRFEIIEGTRSSAHKLVSHGEAVTFRDTQTGDCFLTISATRNFGMAKVDCPEPHFGGKSKK